MSQDFFQPKYCAGYANSANPCMTSYCSCIAECSALCTTQAARTSFTALAACFGSVSFLAMLAMFIKLTFFPSPTTTTTTTTTTVAPDMRTRNIFNWRNGFFNFVDNIIIDSIVAIEYNSALRLFLPAWALDTFSQLLFVCNLGYFVRYVNLPEFSIAKSGGTSIDCNQGVPIPGTASDSWQVNIMENI